VGGHIEVKNATTIMGQHEKHVEDLETDGRDGEEIDGDELRDVVLEEGAPSLRRWLAATHHVFAHAGLADVDTEFEQFAVNSRCTPCRIFSAHPADEISNLTGNDRASRLSVPHLPGPKPAKPLAMPGHDGFRFHDDQGRAPIPPDAGQVDPEEAIS